MWAVLVMMVLVLVFVLVLVIVVLLPLGTMGEEIPLPLRQPRRIYTNRAVVAFPDHLLLQHITAMWAKRPHAHACTRSHIEHTTKSIHDNHNSHHCYRNTGVPVSPGSRCTHLSRSQGRGIRVQSWVLWYVLRRRKH